MGIGCRERINNEYRIIDDRSGMSVMLGGICDDDRCYYVFKKFKEKDTG